MSQQRVRIKMCGTTRVEDVQAAVACGVDAIGFIFVETSPRYIEPQRVTALIDLLPPFITRAGVFVDSPMTKIVEIVESCGLTHIQLHGDESPELCRELKQRCKGCSICKAFRVGAGSPECDASAYNAVVDSVLLDTYVEGVAGGTGKSFDWELVAHLRLDRPLILAGGLSPGNVTQAVHTVWPYAIDINSGVEQSPGVKDHRLLADLTSIVRMVERQRMVSRPC